MIFWEEQNIPVRRQTKILPNQVHYFSYLSQRPLPCSWWSRYLWSLLLLRWPVLGCLAAELPQQSSLLQAGCSRELPQGTWVWKAQTGRRRKGREWNTLFIKSNRVHIKTYDTRLSLCAAEAGGDAHPRLQRAAPLCPLPGPAARREPREALPAQPPRRAAGKVEEVPVPQAHVPGRCGAAEEEEEEEEEDIAAGPRHGSPCPLPCASAAVRRAGPGAVAGREAPWRAGRGRERRGGRCPSARQAPPAAGAAGRSRGRPGWAARQQHASVSPGYLGVCHLPSAIAPTSRGWCSWETDEVLRTQHHTKAASRPMFCACSFEQSSSPLWRAARLSARRDQDSPQRRTGLGLGLGGGWGAVLGLNREKDAAKIQGAS